MLFNNLTFILFYMINLAGVETADQQIREELYLAGIPMAKVEKTNTEVPYTIIGQLGNWTFTRAWYYWVATVQKREEGLLLDLALQLYNTKHPTDNTNLSEIIRAGGCAGCTSPNEYISQPVYNDELDSKLVALGYKKVYSDLAGKEYIPISVGEIAKLCKQGKLIVDRYVKTYHIDEQIGLLEFANFIKKNGGIKNEQSGN